MAEEAEDKFEDLEYEIEDLKKEIDEIQERNRGVEVDKEWETSKARSFIISVLTYLSIALYLNVIRVPMPWLNAIVPAVAFLLSTLTLPIFKKWWIRRVYGRENIGKSPHR